MSSSAYRGMDSETGSNVYNDVVRRLGRTRGNVRPRSARPVPPPDVSAPAGQFGFTFDRSGYRVPAIRGCHRGSSGSVYNDEHRHTSLIATLTKLWDIGGPFTERDKAAKPIDYVFTRETPRGPDSGRCRRPTLFRKPNLTGEVCRQDDEQPGQGCASWHSCDGEEDGPRTSAGSQRSNFHLTPWLAYDVQTYICAHFWPELAPQGKDMDQLKTWLKEDLRMRSSRNELSRSAKRRQMVRQESR